MTHPIPGALALALSLAATSVAQAADTTPKGVYDACINDADKAKADDLKLCVGKVGQTLQNCQQRAQDTRIAADAICVARMQRAVNTTGARDRERAAREAARSGRPQ